MPSSCTSSIMSDSPCVIPTVIFWAFACLTAFVTSSAAAKYSAVSSGSGRRPVSVLVNVVGTEVLVHSERTASFSPRSASSGGRIPRTSPRSSCRAVTELFCAWESICWARSGSSCMSAATSLRVMPMETRCA